MAKKDEFVGPATLLKDSDLAEAAEELHVELATIQAVAEVEAAGKGFLADKRPKILFESFVFHQRTGGRFDGSNPGISKPKWTRDYVGGAGEYDRLAQAIGLDRDAALKSASWGRFQIMGFNHRDSGFPGVEEFVASQVQSEGAHLRAFINIIKNWKLDDELRDHRWAAFARAYNGPGFAKNQYDVKLQAAYEKYSRGTVAPTIAQLQEALIRHGFAIVADGVTGPATREAIRRFQESKGLVADGIAGPKTWAALGLAHGVDRIALAGG